MNISILHFWSKLRIKLFKNKTSTNKKHSEEANQSVLKEINPEYSLKGLMLKLKLKNFGHLMRRASWLEKTLMLGKIKEKRRRWQRMRWLDGITDSIPWVWANSGRYWRTGKPGLLQSMGLQKFRHNLVTEQQYCFYIHILLNWLWSNIYFHSFTHIASSNLSLMSQINEFNNLLFNLYLLLLLNTWHLS